MSSGGDKGPVKVGDVLGKFLKKKGLQDVVSRAGVVDQWEERVGGAIAGVTRARGIRGGTLFVEVRSSAWLMELNLMKEEILRRINEGREEAPMETIVFVLAEDPTQ